MTDIRPDISVIIPHLNQPDSLQECLASLAAQTLPRSRFEIIVVDNGSSSSVEPIVSQYYGISLLNESIPGPGPARNRGAELARGNILAFMDADCQADPDWLRVALQTIRSVPAGTILGGDVSVRTRRGAQPNGVTAYERLFGYRFKLYVEAHGYSGTGNLVVNRDDFEKIGPFVGINFAEDMEWGRRARQYGFSFRYVPEMKVFHPPRATLAELCTKWDRHIVHRLADARHRPGWRLLWFVRALAVFGSPIVDFFRTLTSSRIQGVQTRAKAIGVLFYIRWYRAIRVLASLGARKGEVLWNRRATSASSCSSTETKFATRSPIREKASDTNSSLIAYALSGLENCWLPEYGRWSHIYHLDGRSAPNESVPESDVFYSLNVLLGLSRVSQVPRNLSLSLVFEQNALQLLSLPVPRYALGMALWVSAELQLELPPPVLDQIRVVLSDRANWLRFTAQDLGMIIAGVVARAKTEKRQWHPLAHELFKHLNENYACESGLFFNNVSHSRRRFTSFATHTYMTLACYLYGELTSDGGAIERANACVRKLLSLQGPSGEWPWFYDTRRGTIVDYYELYSVHQYGMAPAFLEIAERHGVPGSREALISGFQWVLGNNQLRRTMLVPDRCLTIRSQVRKRELGTKAVRAIRSIGGLILPVKANLADPTDVMLRLECRSYELGWILWSFGRRDDLPQLTEHPDFTQVCKGERSRSDARTAVLA